MLKKWCLIGFVLVLICPLPALGNVKVNWDTNLSYDNSADSRVYWDSGFQTIGDWLIRPNWSFYLRDKIKINSDTHEWNGILERGYLQYQTDSYRIKLGRQAVIWGLGWIFRPTDLVTPQQDFKQDETRPGRDLATLYWATSPLTVFELTAGEDLAAIRSEWRLNETNLRLLGIVLPDKNKVLGFDFQGGLAGLYGEVGFSWLDEFEAGSLSAMLGWKKTLSNNNLIFTEYYSAKILDERQDERQNQLGIGIEIPFDELTMFDVIAVYNFEKKETLLTGLATMEISDSLDIKTSVVLAPDSQIVLKLQSIYYF